MKAQKAALLAVVVILAAGASPCCTRLEESGGGSVRVLTKVYELSSDAVTAEGRAAVRASVNENTGEFVWTGAAAEQINYYTTYGNATRDVKSTGTQSGATTRVSIDYTSGDDYVVMLTKGGGVGAVSTTPSSTTWVVTDGIPATQDGTIDGSLVSIGRASIGDNSLSLVPSQAYISFSLASIALGGKTVSKVSVRSESGGDTPDEDIAAASVTYNVAGGYNTYSGGVKTIEMSATLTVNRKYYIAVLPKKYAAGIRIILKDSGGAEIGYVITGKNITPASGHVTNLGTVDLHERVLPTEMKIEPESVHIVNETSCKLTKKLYMKAVPADVTDIEWISSDTSVATVAAGDDWYDTDGTRYLTATVTPVAKPAWNDEKNCTITARSKLRTSLTEGKTKATRTVYVGHFVDLGLSVLWCAENIQGNAATDASHGVGKELPGDLKLTENVLAYGNYYMWGYPTSHPKLYLTVAMYMKRWADQGYSYGWTDPDTGAQVITGGKYHGKSGMQTLDSTDDVAQVMTQSLGNGLKMRLPTYEEMTELNALPRVPFYTIGGISGMKYTSDRTFYKDMFIFLPMSGEMTTGGYSFAAGSALNYMSSQSDYSNEAPAGGPPWTPVFPSGVRGQTSNKQLTGHYYYLGLFFNNDTNIMRTGCSARPVKARP